MSLKSNFEIIRGFEGFTIVDNFFNIGIDEGIFNETLQKSRLVPNFVLFELVTQLAGGNPQ